MCTIVIVTKNILVEQQLQERLQYLGHEVFCTEIETNHPKLPVLMRLFDSLILSETLSNEAVELINQQISAEQLTIEVLRKIEVVPLQESSDEEDRGFYNYLSTQATLEELRELYAHKSTNWEDNDVPTDILSSVKLSQTEERLMKVLLENKETSITRQMLCEKIWGEEPTNSNLSQLSTLIKKIRSKFEKVGVEENLVLTHWGQGYQLNPAIEPLLYRNFCERF